MYVCKFRSTVTRFLERQSFYITFIELNFRSIRNSDRSPSINFLFMLTSSFSSEFKAGIKLTCTFNISHFYITPSNFYYMTFDRYFPCRPHFDITRYCLLDITYVCIFIFFHWRCNGVFQFPR